MIDLFFLFSYPGALLPPGVKLVLYDVRLVTLVTSQLKKIRNCDKTNLGQYGSADFRTVTIEDSTIRERERVGINRFDGGFSTKGVAVAEWKAVEVGRGGRVEGGAWWPSGRGRGGRVEGGGRGGQVEGGRGGQVEGGRGCRVEGGGALAEWKGGARWPSGRGARWPSGLERWLGLVTGQFPARFVPHCGKNVSLRNFGNSFCTLLVFRTRH